MKRLVMVIALLIPFLTLACGGGGGGSDVTRPSQSFVGTYELSGICLFIQDLSGWLCDDDFDPWSGEWIVGPISFTQSYIILGNPVDGDDGAYTITFTNGNTEGFISGTNFITMDFLIDDYDVYTEQTYFNLTYGQVTEVDWWTKVSDSYQ